MIYNKSIENDRVKLGYSKDGSTVWATYKEVFENAMQQEKDGIKPSYCYSDYKTRETITPPGFLIWSLNGGCGVVYRRECDNKLILVEGMQGDFIYNMEV